MSEAAISVRDSLAGAIKELSDPGSSVGETGAAASEVSAAEAAAPTTETVDATAREGRDEKGRFAPKEKDIADSQTEVSADALAAGKDAATQKTETAIPADTESQTSETIRPPPSLPAAVKAMWSELQPEVQQAFDKLERSVLNAKAEWEPKGARLNRYEEIVTPRLEKFALQGLDEFTAIKTLFAAQDLLDRSPLEGIQHLARSYGVNLAAHFGQPGQQAQSAEGQRQPTPTVDPRLMAVVDPLQRQVQTLQQTLEALQQGSESAKLASAQAEIADFASKPENLYFDNVRMDVAKRLETGEAKTLAEAYDQAIWASKEIRPLLLKQQAQAGASRETQAAQQRKAASASQAAGSVTGAPAGTAQAVRAGSSGSVRADIEAAMREHGATV